MKIFKPIALGLVTKPFDSQGSTYFVFTLLVGFRFDEANTLLSEAAIWETAAEQLPEGVIFDEGMWKRRGEVLVTGSAHSVGEARSALGVRIQLGSIDKRLYVVGDRHWETTGATAPVPFTAMPLSWQNAFGGSEHEPNPLGKGLASGDGKQLLPNVEHPDKLVKSPGDRPPPVSFEGVAPHLRARIDKLGTYDANWLRKGFPGYAEDIDWTAFNAAPSDQWLADDTFFVGDEPFHLENLHPEQAVIDGALPGLTTRLFVCRGEDQAVVELPTRLDTVRLFPSVKCGVLIFRAVTGVADEEASDIPTMMAAVEKRGEAKSLSHYQDVLDRRRDPDRGFLEALKEKDLLPAGFPSSLDLDGPDFDEGELAREDLVGKNLRAKAQLELDRLKAKLREHGVDPAEHDVLEAWPEPEEAPALDEIGEWIEEKKAVADAELEKAEEARRAAEDKARKICEEQGLDFDELVKNGESENAGPQLMNADRQLSTLRDQLLLSRNAGVPLQAVEDKLADPNLREKLLAAEAAYQAAYRRCAHLMPAAKRLDAGAAAALRAEVIDAKASGASLAGRDFTGADLSKLDLRGVDLTDAFLENANLAGCDLSEANLKNAVLARANLTAAKLRGTHLERANLGNAQLIATNLDGALAAGAILGGARCHGATFLGAQLQGADFTDVTLKGANLTGVEARETIFFGVDLSGLCLREAKLDKASFVECRLTNVELVGASLQNTNFVTCNLDGANFAKASAAGVKLAATSSARKADFKGADLSGACFAGTDLAESDFSGALLGGANLAKCDLSEAKLYRVRARGAMLMQANLQNADLTSADLLESLFMRANIAGAIFKGSNLFRANFIKVRGDDATSFEKANMDFICYAGGPA